MYCCLVRYGEVARAYVSTDASSLSTSVHVVAAVVYGITIALFFRWAMLGLEETGDVVMSLLRI